MRWVDDEIDPDDLAAVQRIYELFETDRIGAIDSSPADIASALARPNFDRADAALVLDGERIVGAILLVVEAASRDVYSDIAVLPGAGERAVLDLAVGHALAAARRIAVERGETGWTLRAGCWANDETFVSVYTDYGIPPVRRFYRMRIDSDSPDIPAQAPELPQGVELVVRDDEETRRTIWAVDNESFLDHWNFTPKPYDEWWAEWSAGDTRDPGGWWLLLVDGEPAAMAVLDESRAELGDGYVALLGVLRKYRGRGLGSLLLQRAFVRYRDMGRLGTQLAVDAESLTGAVGVYERVGMRAVRVVQGHALDVS